MFFFAKEMIKLLQIDTILYLQYGPTGYGSYGSWSPPGTSNETSSGYFLERSNSARKTLEK